MKKLRALVIKYAKKLNTTNLSALRSGNISVRGKEGNINGFYITPSGVKYSVLKPRDIVFVSLQGRFDKKKKKPSSEWRFHQDIYINKKCCKAIVHSHSLNATALSTHRVKIPAFNYMVAIAGGIDIKCAEYATFGTKQLSNNIIKALKDRTACLIANHGQITYGSSLDEAFELAEEIENISKQYILARQLGNPKILSLNQMEKVLNKFKNYKK